MKKLLFFFMSLFSFFAFGQLSEGFENPTFPPPGWVVTDNGIGTVQSWGRNTILPNTWTIGTASAMSNREGSVPGLAQDWLITPQVTVPANGQLRFFARSFSPGEQGSVYKVLLSTASQNRADFTTTLATYTELQINESGFQQFFILLDAYAGQNVHLAFVHEVTGGLGDRWILDKVNVDRQCLQLTNLTVSAIGDVSVNLGWSNPTGATQWEIEYGPTGFVQGTGTVVTGITSNPYTLTGLTAATTYDFYVRAVCGLDNISPWSDSKTFTTALCAASQQCDFIFRMTDSWGDGWNGNTMSIRQFGQTVATIGGTFTTGNGPVNVTVPLCSNQPFELFWNTGGAFANEVGVAIIDPLGVQIYNKPFNTGTQGTVLYSGPALCTPPTCPAPTNITVSGLTIDSGTITWTDNAGATQWEVIIQPAGTGYPPNTATPTAVVSSPTYSFSGFPSATSFEVYIRAICSPTDSSIWGGPRTFATLISNDECAAAINVPVNTGTACINSVNGTVLGATASSQANGCAGTDDDDVWFQFTATEGTHTISLVNVVGSATDMYHVVYSGTCGALTQLYCSDNNSSVASSLIPGQTYYIRVYTVTATPNQNTTFTLCVGTPVDCSDATAFCGETGLVYTNSVGVPSYGGIGCLFTTPNPSWYFMQVSQSGNLTFQISQTNSATGGGIDVDYIIWGPFTPAQFATSCNDLYDFPDGNTTIPNNVASCSYSAAAVENFTINNAQINNIYIVLITNFSNQPGTVTFTQTNLNGTGAGATNCDIVCSTSLGPDQTLCADSYQIVSSNATADAYQWFFNGVLIPGETANTLTVYQSGTYKVRITCGINNIEDEIVVTLNETIVPTFATPGSICSGSPNISLSNTSINGITGQWSLSGNPVTEISTATPGTYVYTFTPNIASFPCSPTFQMNVEILGTCTFNSFATAVWIQDCTNTATDGEFYNVTGIGSDLIGPSTNVFPSSDLGIYIQNSGNLILRGGELKSFKTPSSNVCSARLNYRIYEATATPGAFTVLNLPFFDDCVAGNFASGGACNVGDQKWQEVLNNAESPIDLTNYPAGNYVIEVYFDLTGDNNSTTDCDDTIFVNNNGTNYKANFTIQSSPIFTFTNEQCGSSNATITASGFIAGESYSVTYTDGSVVVGPTNYIANSSGQIILAGLNAGTYADFNFQINGCDIFNATPIAISNFSPSITQVTSNTAICIGDNAVFTIEGSPGFNVNYTINGGTIQTIALDATTGLATITVNNPAVGTVNLQLVSIFNPSCSILVNNTSSVVVNALPTATLGVVDSNICLGVGNADFVITGTPNATVSYTINGGAPQTINIQASGSVTVSVPLPTADVTLELTGVTFGICSNTTTGQISTIVVTSIPVPTINVTQVPTCSDQTASFTVTSPVNTVLNTPSDLFISEITDHTSGALTYVEIYNGTGSAKDLSNYKLKVYTNVSGTPTCNLALSGILANDDVVVIKLSSSPNQGGIVPDLSFTTCAGVNNNDNIILTTSTDVELDNWGVNQVIFTPAGGVGYNYRRLTSAVLPTMTWNPADWNVIDWTNTAPNLPDYSDVGYYSLYVTNYQYTLSNGVTTTTQASTNFTGIVPGTYTLVATDLVTGCNSNPLTFTIDPATSGTPVTDFSYTTPICTNGTNPVPATVVGFATGGVYSSSAGLSINSSTGEIDLGSSLPGTYTVTYSIAATACSSAGSSTFDITINPLNTIAAGTNQTVCINSAITNITLATTGATGATFTGLPAGVTGSWSGNVVTISGTPTVSGTFNYTVTTTGGCPPATTSGTITVTPLNTIAAGTNQTVCQNTAITNITLATTGATGATFTGLPAGVTGSWSGNVVTISGTPTVSGTFNYTVTTTGGCPPATTSGTITVTPLNTIAAGTNQTVCVNSAITNITLATTGATGATFTGLPAGVTGSWSGNVVTISGTPTVSGTFNYTVTTTGGCLPSITSGNIIVENRSIPTFTQVDDLCLGASIQLPLESNEGVTGTWSPSVVNTSQVGIVTYTFTPDAAFCADPTTMNINVIGCEIPKGISPNNDTYNDVWDLSGYDVSKVEIFNRYGTKVYSKSNYSNEWHGQSDNGNELPDGTYYYVIEFNGLPAKTGWVYINRQQ